MDIGEIKTLLLDMRESMNADDDSFDEAIRSLSFMEDHLGSIPSLYELMKVKRVIGSIWDTDDVLDRAEWLTEDQAWAVLQDVDKNQNADAGICNDTIWEVIKRLFPEPA